MAKTEKKKSPIPDLVDDYYNLIYRHNLNNYFLCHIVKKTQVHFVSHGDSFIKDIKWMKIDDAISAYASMKDTGLESIIKRRELPILLMLTNLINLKRNHIENT